jgi:hypothetical protein
MELQSIQQVITMSTFIVSWRTLRKLRRKLQISLLHSSHKRVEVKQDQYLYLSRCIQELSWDPQPSHQVLTKAMWAELLMSRSIGLSMELLAKRPLLVLTESNRPVNPLIEILHWMTLDIQTIKYNLWNMCSSSSNSISNSSSSITNFSRASTASII